MKELTAFEWLVLIPLAIIARFTGVAWLGCKLFKGYRIGRLSSIFTFGGYSACSRCSTNWFFVESRSVDADSGWGCFALCKPCWREAEPAERSRHYLQLVASWGPSHHHTSKDLADIVRECNKPGE